MTSKPAVLQRDPEDPRRVTLMELFLDLVYVVALALISRGLAENPTLGGAFHVLVLLLATWWVWSITALVTNYYDPRTPPMQTLTLGVMFGSLLMAAAIPSAFGPQGIVFAGAYVAIHLGRGLLLVPTLKGQGVQLRAMRVVLWFAISAIPWIAGGIMHGVARSVLWTVALVIDYGAGKLRYPTPGLGRVPAGQYNVTAEHLAERFQQFFIIALGNAVLIMGVTFSQTDFDLYEVCAFVLAFVVTALLWRIYVHRAGEVLSAAIEQSDQPERFISSAPLTQLAMVLGVVTTSAGFEFVIQEPLTHNSPERVAIMLGGPVLFLLGRSRFEYEVFGRVSRNRPIALIALIAFAPAMAFATPLVAVLTDAVVLGAIAVHDTIRSRGRPPEQPKPPL